jgi:hypothetical protein
MLWSNVEFLNWDILLQRWDRYARTLYTAAGSASAPVCYAGIGWHLPSLQTGCCEYLNRELLGQWIWRDALFPWPPNHTHSLLNFFLWGYVKDTVHKQVVTGTDDLLHNAIKDMYKISHRDWWLSSSAIRILCTTQQSQRLMTHIHSAISTVYPAVLQHTPQEVQYCQCALCQNKSLHPHLWRYISNFMSFTSYWLTPQAYSVICPILFIQVKNIFFLHYVLIDIWVAC